MKEENEKAVLTLNSQKTNIMASGLITSGQIDGEIRKQWQIFFFFNSKIIAEGDSSREIKRRFLLGRKAMTNLAR